MSLFKKMKFAALCSLLFLASCSSSSVNKRGTAALPLDPYTGAPQVNNPDEVASVEDVGDNPEDQEIEEEARSIHEEALARRLGNPRNFDNGRGNFIHASQVPEDKYERWVEFFSNQDRERFIRFLTNGRKYKDVVHSILDEYKLPRELFYVALIESGFYTQAKSRARAVGPWQFMAGTGKAYGLKVNSSLDERRNIFKATRAAARYMSDLYNIFGNWRLALSAYNAGENKIIRIIRKSKTREFSELINRRLLPKETLHYVPKLMAAIHVAETIKESELEAAGELETPWRYDDYAPMKLTRPVSLKELASSWGMSLSDLRDFNPDMKNDLQWATAQKPITLFLPHALIAQNKALPPSPKVAKPLETEEGTHYHIVRRGENLKLIARKYRVSIAKLQQWNRLTDSTRIFPRQRLQLVAPTRDVASIKEGAVARPTGKAGLISYKVKRGDHMNKIAQKFNVTVDEIKKHNQLKKEVVYRGQMLKIPTR